MDWFPWSARLVADPDLGVKPLLARLREQQPGLGAGTMTETDIKGVMW